MAKAKSIELKFTPRDIGRGEWGKKFYISTFRFPLEEAQKFERRAKALGFTMSSLANQLIMTFNKAVGEPKNVKLDRTAHPTIWGADAKKSYFKKKGLKVPVKRSDAKVGKKTEKAAPKKAKVKTKKPMKAVKQVKTTKAPQKQAKLKELLARLKASRKNEAA